MSELFDVKFQNLFLCHALRDTTFLDRIHADVIPELFGNEYAQRACRLIVEFFRTEHTAPGELIFHVLDDLKAQQLLGESLASNLSTYIDDLFKLPLHNRVYLLKEFDRFVRHQRFRKDIIPAAELVTAGRFDEAEELLKHTFAFHPRKEHDLGRMLEADPTKRIRRRLEEDTQRFWWLIPEIDRVIRGSKRGELGVLQSQRSSAGKSAALAFLARQYAFQNKRILIYTLEMSEEEYEDRLDMCIAGVVKEALTDHQRLSRKLGKMFKRGGRIWIKQFPGQLSTVSDLREHKQLLEQVHGFYADAILVDYADELGSENRSRAGNTFEVGKEIYSHLRGWAVKDDVVIWTGMQSNRSAGDVDVADMENSGESIAKAWIADLIISINRTKKEAEDGTTRLYVVKNRTGIARFTIKIKTDFQRMQFVVQDRLEVADV
jgi:galactitol-specific phosphotransferase system IIB component